MELLALLVLILIAGGVIVNLLHHFIEDAATFYVACAVSGVFIGVVVGSNITPILEFLPK
jgi:hypothetical protein